MMEGTYYFPPGFLWGTATSAHQVEGGNSNNDWWDWEQGNGRIIDGQTSAKACDWWGGRWREDLSHASDMGQNAHRFSIEWSRVEPDPEVWDENALAYYRDLAKGILDRGMKPMITLHHFTNPLWVARLGGWLNPEIVGLFERFSRKVVDALSDLADMWVTINEPNIYAYSGYLDGVFPPGEMDLSKMIKVLENMLMAHAAAYQAIHEIQPEALVGVAHHYRGFLPASTANPLDRFVANFRSRYFNDIFPNALIDGKARFPGRTIQIPQAAGTQDYFGLNYYTVERDAFDLQRSKQFFTRDFYPQSADLSPTGHMANEPEGFAKAIEWANSYGLPIYITENGVEDQEDQLRPRYIVSHIWKLWMSVNSGCPVRGYFHWSLVDNFEWERGWTQRFGLWELDVESQKRHKRRSADLYAQICTENGLSSEMVASYAPEVLPELFPGKGPGDLQPIMR